MFKHVTWLDRYRQRHTWALDAYDAFSRELVPELSQQVIGSDQVTIVVYGATQVGKTSLILDLLGISSSTRDEAALVLRGKQQSGKSATATPIRYGRSGDDLWYIGKEGPLDAEEATCKLAALRDSMQAGQRHDTEIVDILIPRRLFKTGEGEALDVDLKLIDIPGLNAHNAHEQALVERTARRYVAIADLVLLVVQANGLGALLPENLKIEELAQWTRQPLRYRVVITSGYSLSSIRKQLLHGELNTGRVRAEMVKQMETFDLKIPDDVHDNLYVLELGDSAQDLAVNDPDYHARITPLIAGFRGQLIEDIKQAAGPFARLYAAFQLDRVINGHIDYLRERFKERLEEVHAERRRLQDLFTRRYPELNSDIQEAMQQAHEEGLAIEADRSLHIRLLSKLQEMLSEAVFIDSFAIETLQASKSVSALLGVLEQCKGSIRLVCQAYQQPLEQCLEQFKTDHPLVLNFPEITFDDRDFRPIEYHLESYKTDGYWIDSNFDSDASMVQRAIDDSIARHAALACSTAQDYLKKQIAVFTAQSQAHKTRLDTLAKDLQRLAGQRVEERNARQQLAEGLQRMRSSRQLARHFERRINSAFLKELASLRAQIHCPGNPAHGLLSLLNTKLLITEANKLYAGRGHQ